MRDLLIRYRTLIVCGLCLGLPLFSLYFHGKTNRAPNVIEESLVYVTSPVEHIASVLFGSIGGMWTDYVALVGVEEENRQLREENRVLLGEAKVAKRFRRENERLKSLLVFKEKNVDLSLAAARVIGRDISPHYRVVRLALDVGTEDQVTADMPVVTHEGVVGRVTRVSGGYSEVMLVVDARSNISVTIPGKGVSGHLIGIGDRNEYRARLRFLDQSKPIDTGDVVLTSGLDSVFPPGLEVGVITNAEQSQDGYYYVYQVTPSVNFSLLEEVFVVLDGPDRANVLAGENKTEGSP